MKVIPMALTDQGRDRAPYRIVGQITDLWELIQAAYEEDRQWTHERISGTRDQWETLAADPPSPPNHPSNAPCRSLG